MVDAVAQASPKLVEELVPKVVSLGEIQRVLRQLLRERVRMEMVLGAPDAQVQIDEGQLEPMLLNLATNAMHAMPEGGTFRVETTICEPERIGAAARRDLSSARGLIGAVVRP